ncbi:MAG: D-tyrosyl-tRNA(Tyr) deacylase, partial [Phycisphaeraceae bacterium]|nr:D-tyrosyl-tRNA(Tyr) deacylase [Phycisphaeraceae bacterium]
MRIVLQRVNRASVEVKGETTGRIGVGLLALVGVADGDTGDDARAAAAKIVGMRVFPDADGKMNRSITDGEGAILLVSQFTLLGDVRKGRRPAFTEAAAPELAIPILETLAETIEAAGVAVEHGRFGAHMVVDLVNDGPVTIV